MIKRKVTPKVIYESEEKNVMTQVTPIKIIAPEKKKFDFIHKIHFVKLFFLFSLSFFLCSLVFFADSKISKKTSPAHHIFTQTIEKVKTTSVTDTPTATLTQQPSPTITQAKSVAVAVPSGFCLNAPMPYWHHIEPMFQATAEGHQSLTVDSTIFDKQMNYLVSAGYQTISVDELVTALLNHQQLPAKSIVLTFDDGYSDIYTYAFPIFRKYNITANLMIPTGLMGVPGYMTWDQLKEMVSSGKVFAYNHTWSHASLGAATKDKIEYEIGTADSQLQQNLGHKVTIFAYPYGSMSPLAVQVLQEHGYIAALSTLGGSYQCDGYIMALRRIHMGNASMQAYGF